MNVFTIGGKTYNVSVLSLKRKAAVLDGDKAGRTQDARMHRDIKGTFYNYTMELEAKHLDIAQYDELYELLSAPKDSHSVTFPYAQRTLSFDAYVTNADDELLHMKNDKNVWGGLSVNFIAMSPERLPE